MITGSKKVVISQSNYIPWKGYFDMINSADEFVIYDDVQYTRRDWRNRNKVVTPGGVKWLTIPVETKGKYHQKVNETKISEANWASQHWLTLRSCYKKAHYFKYYEPLFEDLYLDKLQSIEYLSKVNELIIRTICMILGINTKIVSSSNFKLKEDRNERLVAICQELGATTYFSGPAAKNYIETERFRAENIEVKWMDYSGYLEYPQCYGAFEHGVSILDLLFNCGLESKKYMKSFSSIIE
jgi:WbqC-like protein family